jgi:hypothetical protein
MNKNTIKHDPKWSYDYEMIFVDWADKAMCYRWLHYRSHGMYCRKNAWFTIPVIIISTVTGTANFAQDTVSANYKSIFLMCVGGLNILAGIISTIHQFLKITQLKEAHRVSSISWDKFYRNLKIELAKHPNERMEITQLLKVSKDEYDRLMDASPDIPDSIISLFKKTFKNSENFLEIKKPEICDGMVSTQKYRNRWYMDLDEDMIGSSNVSMCEETKNTISISDDIIQNYDIENEKCVDEFIVSFQKNNAREPFDHEIIGNLKALIKPENIQKILERKKMDIEIEEIIN